MGGNNASNSGQTSQGSYSTVVGVWKHIFYCESCRVQTGLGRTVTRDNITVINWEEKRLSLALFSISRQNVRWVLDMVLAVMEFQAKVYRIKQIICEVTHLTIVHETDCVQWELKMTTLFYQCYSNILFYFMATFSFIKFAALEILLNNIPNFNYSRCCFDCHYQQKIFQIGLF